MGTKTNPGEFDCHAKADPDEPLFTLIGRDPTASLLVGLWVLTQQQLGKPHNDPKLDEARKCAAQMTEWARAHKSSEEVHARSIAFKRAVIQLAQWYRDDERRPGDPQEIV